MKLKKPNKLEIRAEEVVEIFSKKATLEELREEIEEYVLMRGSDLGSMIVTIERRKKGVYSTIYFSNKNLKKRYH